MLAIVALIKQRDFLELVYNLPEDRRITLYVAIWEASSTVYHVH
jgi:hypothetical protein